VTAVELLTQIFDNFFFPTLKILIHLIGMSGHSYRDFMSASEYFIPSPQTTNSSFVPARAQTRSTNALKFFPASRISSQFLPISAHRTPSSPRLVPWTLLPIRAQLHRRRKPCRAYVNKRRVNTFDAISFNLWSIQQ
jgi:hypothetical protein